MAFITPTNAANIPYHTFSSLIQAMGDGKISGDSAGKITDTHAADALLQFYQYWNGYLHPMRAIFAYINDPLGALAKAMYYIVNSLENVFNNMFKLLGLFGYLQNNSSVLGQFYKSFQLLGVAIFTLFLVVRVLTGLFGKKFKYKAAINNILLVTVVVGVLPLTVNKISGTMAEDVQKIQQVQNGGDDDSYSSLALQPIKNNVVDLKVLIDNDFNAAYYPLDSTGYIKPVASDTHHPINNIKDNTNSFQSSNYVGQVNFGATYGVTDTDYLDDLEKAKTTNTGYKGLFEHRINDAGDGVTAMSEHRFASGFSAVEYVYPRYKANWVAMYAQFIVLAVLLAMMSIKVVKSIFETVLNVLIAPILGYASVESSKKFKELLMTIVGGIAGIFFEMVILRVTLEFMRDLPTLSVQGITNLSGGFFDGLNMWETAIASILVYIGMFFAAMQGVTIIERWLGVSTGHSDTAQQIMGGLMLAGAAGSGLAAMGHGTMAAGAGAINLGKRVPTALGHATNAAKKGGLGLMAAGGALNATKDAIKEQGLKQTAANGLNNAAGKAKQGFTDGKNAVGNKLGVVDQAAQGSYDGQYDKTRTALGNPKDDLSAVGASASPDGNTPVDTSSDSGDTSALESDLPQTQEPDSTPVEGVDGVQIAPEGNGQAEHGDGLQGGHDVAGDPPTTTIGDASAGLDTESGDGDLDTPAQEGIDTSEDGGLDMSGDAQVDDGGIDAGVTPTSDTPTGVTIDGQGVAQQPSAKNSGSGAGVQTTGVGGTDTTSTPSGKETKASPATPLTINPSGVAVAQPTVVTTDTSVPSGSTPAPITTATTSQPQQAQPILASPLPQTNTQTQAVASPTTPTHNSSTTNRTSIQTQQVTSTPSTPQTHYQQATQPKTPKIRSQFYQNQKQKAAQDLAKMNSSVQMGGQQAFSGRSALHGTDIDDDGQD